MLLQTALTIPPPEHPLTAVWQGWCEAALPPPDLTVSQWADRERVLPETAAARGAKWRTDDVPYLRGVMDAVHEPGVTRIAVKKAAQVGGSEALHNILGYHMAFDPCPMLFVHPTEHVAQEWSKERLTDMIRSTPALARVIRGNRARLQDDDVESTLLLKLFIGGYLAIGGANTENTFARRAIRIAAGDDVDRWPGELGEEGDPVDLLAKRTTTFEDYDPLVIYVSTPTLKGGRIDTLYQRSDRRRFFVRCPACGREDWITWSGKCDDEKCGRTHMHVVFEGHDPATARLLCPGGEHGGCGAQLDETARRTMIAIAGAEPGGGWQATATAQEDGLVGFSLPAMISTLGVTLPKMVDDFLSARAKGTKSLRVFVNTTLAEGWEERGARLSPHRLNVPSRRTDYGGPDVEVPEWAGMITAGVDVQDNRFEVQVIAWGAAMERAVVDWRSIPGDPKRAETREELWTALQRRYRHALGVDIPILGTCVDTGYATEEMYDFVLAHQVHRVYATKGVAGQAGEPIVVASREKRRGQRARPVKLWLVNTDDAKTDLYASLNLVEPGPAYTHFSAHLESLDDEYFAQLCAEHKETRKTAAGAKTHSVWVKDRERNEALDTFVLALAAYKLLNQNVRQLVEKIEAAAAERAATPAKAAAEPVAAPTKPSTGATTSGPIGRRVTRSGYLGR